MADEVIVTESEVNTADQNTQKLRSYEDIYASYSGIDYKKDYPYTSIADNIKANMPRFLRENNGGFYDFVAKITTHIEKMAYWAWILETQWWLDTARGNFLDNIGRWLGMSRPPLPVKRTNEPVVIYPPKQENSSMTAEELLEFNTLHGISSKDEGEGLVKETFYPSRDFVGNVLVNDEEYRIYIKGLLKLRQRLDLISVIDSFAHILTKPFFIVQNDRECLRFKASYEEDSVRLVIIREMTRRLRTTGFNIEVTQATSFDDAQVKALYGENVWQQENPYIENEE